MKTKTLKTDAELCEAIGVPNAQGFAELITKDGSVVGARVGRARFEMSAYTFSATREVEHEEAQRYRVRVDHPAFASINRYFDHESGPARDLAASFDNISDAKVTAGMVTVHVDGSGKVIAELDGDTVMPLAPQEGGDDLPF